MKKIDNTSNLKEYPSRVLKNNNIYTNGDGPVPKKRKRRRLKKLNILLFLVIVVSFIFLIYSSIQFYKWYKDSKNIKSITKEINENVVIEEIEDEEDVQIVEQNTVNAYDSYWDYIKMKLLNVDFADLKKMNTDTIGWITVNGTSINYPFVQTNDNDYYLTHTFDKSYNGAGWVFLDYRNNVDSIDRNNIIYAHGRRDKTMFGSLKNVLKNDWYNNKENHIIKLSTDYKNSLWQIFSIYRIPTTNDYLRINFNTDEDFKDFVDMLQSRSIYQFDTTVSGTDKILTLSTCYNDAEKLVVHAKLIKYSEQ